MTIPLNVGVIKIADPDPEQGWTGKDGSPSPTLGTIITNSYIYIYISLFRTRSTMKHQKDNSKTIVKRIPWNWLEFSSIYCYTICRIPLWIVYSVLFLYGSFFTQLTMPNMNPSINTFTTQVVSTLSAPVHALGIVDFLVRIWCMSTISIFTPETSTCVCHVTRLGVRVRGRIAFMYRR